LSPTTRRQRLIKIGATVVSRSSPGSRVGPGAAPGSPPTTPASTSRARTGPTPTRKLRLAALGPVFDRPVNRHITVVNPAATIETERNAVVEGQSPGSRGDHT